MFNLQELLRSKIISIFSTITLGSLYGLFAYVHLLAFLDTHQLSLILVTLFETVTVIFLIFRTDHKTVTVIPSDWLIAIAGSCVPLFLRPASYGVLPLAEILIILGIMLQIMSLLSLNRSFAIVPANRNIKIDWMYRIIRHPLYASYFLAFGGYVLVHTTVINIIIYGALVILLCMRMFREEKHLSLDPKYLEYMSMVRYRIIPFIF